MPGDVLICRERMHAFTGSSWPTIIVMNAGDVLLLLSDMSQSIGYVDHYLCLSRSGPCLVSDYNMRYMILSSD